MIDEKIIDRFWNKVSKTDGCWFWTASCGRFGYGQLVARFEGGQRRWLAHRLSWVIHFGEIPFGAGYHGTCVLHKCDNPKCVRPDHLFLGSSADNARDMVAKGRFKPPCPHGADSPSAKLTAKQVLDIRLDSRKRIELAKIYHVHYNTIAQIKRGEKWKRLICEHGHINNLGDK